MYIYTQLKLTNTIGIVCSYSPILTGTCQSDNRLVSTNPAMNQYGSHWYFNPGLKFLIAQQVSSYHKERML